LLYCSQEKTLGANITSVKQVFQWGGNKQKSFETLKEKIITVTILALLDLQQPFEIQTNASIYAMEEVLMQLGKPICYHYEILLKK
jgi:hypothetical protein